MPRVRFVKVFLSRALEVAPITEISDNRQLAL